MASKPALKSVEPAAAEGGQPPPPKKKRKLLIIGGLVVLLLAGGGGGAWYYLNGQPKTEATEQDAAASEEKEKESESEKKPSVFLALEPFTVNMQGDGDHYLQIGIVLQIADNKVVEEMKLQMPLLRNKLLLLLSSQSPKDLVKTEDKQKLAEQILEEARQLRPGKTGERGVQAVLFSSLIIQ